MASYSIDAEKFINEIKNHRELWDLDSSGRPYRLKVKENAWSQVATIFIPDFENMKKSEKAEVYRKLYNKWRNIRDAYVRNIKGTRNLSKYVFMKHLQFLNSRYKPDLYKSDEKSNDEDEMEHDEETTNNSCESDEDMPSVIENLKRRRVSRNRQVTDAVPTSMHSAEITNDVFIGQEMEDSTRRKNSELDSFVSISQVKDGEELNYDISSTPSFDEDRSFFDSMLPAVRQFDMDQKLRFRYEVLRLIKDIRASVQNGFKPEPSSPYYVE